MKLKETKAAEQSCRSQTAYPSASQGLSQVQYGQQHTDVVLLPPPGQIRRMLRVRSVTSPQPVTRCIWDEKYFTLKYN